MTLERRVSTELRTQIRAKPKAFTLIEVLLALTLTTMLAALTGQVAVQALTTRETVADILQQLDRDDSVLGELKEDLLGLLPSATVDEAPIQLFGTQHQILQLRTISSVPAKDATLHLVRKPAMVRYRLVAGVGTNTPTVLIRELMDRTSPTSIPVRQTLTRNVRQFLIEIFQEEEWVRLYPTGEGKVIAAQAVRVAIEWDDGHRIAQTTLVPQYE
jgi:prepilin-type N-terminal cleavage/methylation domain-containing protein